MTRQEFFNIAGYFANPIRNSRIEIEAREKTINNYAPHYLAKTGINLPVGSDSITSLPDNADKWGREMRLYFFVADYAAIPAMIDELKTGSSRPGYDNWNQRLNNKDIIDELIALGFTLGNPQNVQRIRLLVPDTDLDDFNNGFNAP